MKRIAVLLLFTVITLVTMSIQSKASSFIDEDVGIVLMSDYQIAQDANFNIIENKVPASSNYVMLEALEVLNIGYTVENKSIEFLTINNNFLFLDYYQYTILNTRMSIPAIDNKNLFTDDIAFVFRC